MIPALGLALGILIGLVLQPTVPLWLQPYLPIAVIAALDAVFGAVRAIVWSTTIEASGLRVVRRCTINASSSLV